MMEPVEDPPQEQVDSTLQTSTPPPPPPPPFLSSVNLFFSEKLLILSNSLQYYSLLHYMMHSHWPTSLLHTTFPITIFTLDIVTLANQSSVSSRVISPQFSGYIFYAIFLSIIPYIFLFFHKQHQAPSSSPIHTLSNSLRSTSFETSMIKVLEFLYLPILLNISKFFNCHTTNRIDKVTHTIKYTVLSTLVVDENTHCDSNEYYIVSGIVLFLTVPFALYFPLWLKRKVANNLSYTSQIDHEKSLQILELEAHLNLSDAHSKCHVFLHSSFSRSSVYHRSHSLFFKLTLVLNTIFFRDSLQFQVAVLWLLFLIPFLRTLARRHYRLKCSSRLYIMLHAVLLFDILLALITVQEAKVSLTQYPRRLPYFTKLTFLRRPHSRFQHGKTSWCCSSTVRQW